MSGVVARTATHPGRAAAWLAKQVELGLGEVGLSLPQYRMLILLSEGSASSSAMARRLAVRPPSVTGLTDGLVARGLIQRRHADTDRRTVSHELTAEGRRVLSQADRGVEARLREIAGSLGEPALEAQAFDALRLWLHAMAAHRQARLASTEARGDAAVRP